MAASSPRAILRQQVLAATWRYRRDRLARFSLVPGWIFCGILLLWLASACISPGLFGSASLALGFASVMAFMSILVILALKVDPRAVQAKMDAAANWPDSVQSASSWPEGEASEWHRLQEEQTMKLLESQSWKSNWPMRWPKLAWVPGVGALAVAILLFMGQARWQQVQARTTRMAEDQAANLQAQKDMLEEVFKDWDQAQKEQPDPELEALLKELEPLREQLAEGKLSEKEVFLEINKVQDRLKSMQDKLNKESIDPMAAELAAAMEPIDESGALAAALQKKDFAKAAEQLQKNMEKLQKKEAEMPKGEKAETAASRMGALAEKAKQNQQNQMSQSLQQMQQGLKEGDSNKMCQGMNGMKQSLQQQSNCQSQKKSLGTQMAQMNACKNPNGKGENKGSGISMGPPKLSLAKSKEPGKGAGTEVDPNRVGAETQLDANREKVGLTGSVGEGDSNVQTESSQVPVFEQKAGGVTAEQFAAYEKMSKQAAEDENLPLSYRESIKRYFENIRPGQQP